MREFLCKLLGIKYPIIQAGMVWAATSPLAIAVSENGGLGTLGAGSMSKDELREEIKRVREATDKPFAVNIPILYGHAEEQVKIAIEEKVPVVITSAGNPKIFTPILKEHGIKVMHVVSSVKFARKAIEAGVDVVIAEGTEAGGHNGREGISTFPLLRAILSEVGDFPVVAAGGIADGYGFAAAMIAGASGIQMGTRFVATVECEAHENFKRAIVEAGDSDTVLIGGTVMAPTRVIRNKFAEEVLKAERSGKSAEEIGLMFKGRSRLGIREGDLENGSLMAGQSVALIKEILPVKEVISRIVTTAVNVSKEFNIEKHFCDK